MSFISPRTGYHYHSAIGRFWPTELEHAGYDTIVIGGKATIPVYLWIDDDQVELRDARHLWGKNTNETRKIIREELNNDKLQVACIGPAGENRVKFASVQYGAGTGASRAGAGALWGDKNLKAIAVRGTRDVSVANPTRLIELSNQIKDRSEPIRELHRDIGPILSY